MTEETKKPAEKKQAKKKVRKVTTGAWWKSSKKSKTEEPAEASVKKKEDVIAAAETKKTKPTRSRTSATGKKQQAKPASPKAEPEKIQERKSAPKAASPDKGNGKQKIAVPKEKKPAKKKEQGGGQKKQSGVRSAKSSQGQQKSPLQEGAKAKGKKVVTKLLINAEEPEECRIAQVENGCLESYHVNTVVRERTKNNIYKGRIVSVEASLQAAFVEIGTGRNGFLPFSDIHPEYYKEDVSEQSRKLIDHRIIA